jgi:hypothetical protein
MVPVVMTAEIHPRRLETLEGGQAQSGAFTAA